MYILTVFLVFYLKMKKSLFLLIFICLFYNLLAQSPQDLINQNNLNEKYLEHLTKIKIDSVRQKHNCKILINDSILFVASKHHAKYMAENSILSHFENKKLETKTPQLRAEYYGAERYGVGENVIKIPLQGSLKDKKGKIINIKTYEDLANIIVVGWINSSGHFKNMITPMYQITGVAIWKNKTTLYACQKFAKVYYKFNFEESKTFFSYSTYQSPKPINSFEGIENKLLDIKYPHDLKHDKPEKCQTCLERMTSRPYLTLRLEGKSFILKIENSQYVKDIIRNKKDGFAVEIVEYQDYACGNPEYYTKPSRRNGQSKLNGKVLKPLYRDELFKGYKRRKKNKKIKFLKYLFNAKGVPFFKRFSQYKIDAYDSKYFEISLGRIPKDIDGYWNYNLVTIQDNQICHIQYFRSIVILFTM